MKCKICNKEHDGVYGSGVFCSKTCSHIRKQKVKICEKCNKEIPVNGYKLHFKNCKNKTSICLTCNKEFEQKNGVEKKYCCRECYHKSFTFILSLSNFDSRKGKKCKELYGEDRFNEMQRRKIEKFKQTISSWTEEKKEEVRRKKSINAKFYNSGRSKSSWYESKIAGKVFLNSTWEVKYAEYLDKNNINWRRNKTKFLYDFENKERHYTPDFYLIDSDEYIEIKGYETEKDKCKWRDFPYKLTVLKYKELIDLGLLD